MRFACLLLVALAPNVALGDEIRLSDAEAAAMRDEVLRLGELTAPPRIHDAEAFETADGIRPIFFDALPHEGRGTRVFAWLGVPQSDEPVPGVVLVHGGGGTAFREWVARWNDEGFAAISIAVEGQTALREATAGQTDQRAPVSKQWQRHAWAGPRRVGIYGDSGRPLADQWMTHAVAATVLANSLLRSQPGVDADAVGIMGISWGGVIASTAIGIDTRFRFAIPTYGCGSLADAANQYGRALGGNEVYRDVWDPILRLDRATMPTLWLTWTGDKHFPLDAVADCYRTSPAPHLLALLPNMRHGHAPGWRPADSYAFARSVVRSGQPWCEQTATERDGDAVTVRFRCDRAVDAAELVFTTGDGFTGLREWTTTEASLTRDGDAVRVGATIPDDATAWFVRLSAAGLAACSDYQTQ